jgi:hypothetical protein
MSRTRGARAACGASKPTGPVPKRPPECTHRAFPVAEGNNINRDNLLYAFHGARSAGAERPCIRPTRGSPDRSLPRTRGARWSGTRSCALSCLSANSINSMDLLDISRLVAILPDRETCITQTQLALQRARCGHVHAAPRAMFVALSGHSDLNRCEHVTCVGAHAVRADARSQRAGAVGRPGLPLLSAGGPSAVRACPDSLPGSQQTNTP